MNTYSNPLTQCYDFEPHDFGAGGDTHDIKGPPGMKGRLRSVLLFQVTEAFTATTTPAFIRVGTAADADKFIEVSCATTAIDAVVSASPDPAVYAPADTEIAADTAVRVTFVAPTGGTPAGIGKVQACIDWYM
jgi:hypothetical protein